MFFRQCDVEGLEVPVELFYLAASNDREDIRHLLHHVCDCDCINIKELVRSAQKHVPGRLARLYVFCAYLDRDFLEHMRHGPLGLVTFPIKGR